jgi:hypothetical protein
MRVNDIMTAPVYTIGAEETATAADGAKRSRRCPSSGHST